MQKMEVGATGISVPNVGQNTSEVSVRVDPADASKHNFKKKEGFRVARLGTVGSNM